MNEVKAEEYYEDFTKDYDPETGETYEYDECDLEYYRIAERNNARKNVLELINKNEKQELKGLRHIKRDEIESLNVMVLCYAAACYEMPGIVSVICYGGITQAGEYVYFWR